VSEERCKHEILKEPPGQCADCKGLGAVADPYEGVLVERFLNAKYPGKCALIPGHKIEPGTEIGVLVLDNEEHRPPFKVLGYGCRACVYEIIGRIR